MQALLHSAYVAFYLFAPGNDGAAGCDQVLSQFGLKVLSLFQLGGIQLVFEPDEEGSSFGNDIGIYSGS